MMRMTILLLAVLFAAVADGSTEVNPITGGGGGGVTSVTASAPLGSSGGATPNLTITSPLPVANGGTGAATASSALSALGGVPTTTTVSTTSPLTGGGALSGNLTVALPAATNSVNGYLTSADHTTFNGKAASGANSDITSLSKIGASGVVFNDTEVTPKTVILVAPSTLNASYTLAWPVNGPTSSPVALLYAGGAQLTWDTNLITSYLSTATYNTKAAATTGAHPKAQAFCSSADGNQDITGAGGGFTCDGLTNQSGEVILSAQTDPTQNGLWVANQFGAWAYDPTWADSNGGCSGQSEGYILTVIGGGTTYGNTAWMVKCNASSNATFLQIRSATRSGTCTVASNTLSMTATNLTCTGVPASSHVAVQCSGQAAFSTSAGSAVYCRATGTVNQIACNTVVANTTAMAYSCVWTQP